MLDSPGGLSRRAQLFLARTAIREPADVGLTGDALRARMLAVYGQVDEEVVRLLASTQQRYSGLSYFSGFFDANVTFSPLCDPENRDEELEISYAIETGSPTGASLRRDGSVEIGLDSAGIVEFASLDAVIECDALFAAAKTMPLAKTVYLDGAVTLDEFSRALPIAAVTEGSGRHTQWFKNESLLVFFCATWFTLGLAMPPLVRIWANDQDSLSSISGGGPGD